MKIDEFIKNRYTQIERYLTHYKEFNIPEDLHQFRVEVKKLNALYQLLNYTSTDFNKKKEFKLHRKIFQRSGEIRDDDVRQELNKNKSLSKDILLRHQKDIENFNKRISGYIRKLKKSRNALIIAGSMLQKKQLKYYLEKRKKKIKKLFQKTNYQKQLHKIRKMCKELIYLSRLYTHKETNAFANLDKLQEHIGKWHNEQLLIKSKDIKNNSFISASKRRAQNQLQQINRLKENYLHYN